MTMDYLQQLHTRTDQLLSELQAVARDFQEIARRGDADIVADRLRQPARLIGDSNEDRVMKRSDLVADFDPFSLEPENREDDTVLTFDCTVPLDGQDAEPCPGTELSRGKYEARLIKTLDGLRGNLKHYVDRYYGPNHTAKADNLRKVRKTLDLIRKVQTVLNRTGSWSFLLVDEA